MKTSIKSKLILILSIFLSALFLLMANLLIQEKKEELTQDIFENTVSFSKFTAPEIAELYHSLLAENSFVYFKRSLQELLNNNENIKEIEIVDYSGNLLFSSTEDQSQKFQGKRQIPQSQKQYLYTESLSFKTIDGSAVFLDRHPPDKTNQLQFLAAPADQSLTIFYYPDYTNLQNRITNMRSRMLYLATFGILLGIIISQFLARKVTKPVDKLVKAAAEIAKGNLDNRVHIRTKDELQTLGQSFNNMAKELKTSLDAKVYKERVTQELQLATEIQTRLIPAVLPSVPGLDIAAGLIPAEEIGGDIYDFIQLPDDRTLIYLGDVTGHGVPAGIVSSIANALFYGFSKEKDLKKILTQVNKVMKSKIMTTMFMTLVLTEWDHKQQTFRYASAGHEQILHYKAKEKTVELLPAGGVALAMIPNIENNLEIVNVPLQKGDFLVIYSDGIPEMWRNKQENYGMKRFTKAVQSFGDLHTALGIKKAILADVEQFAGGYKQMDDVTLIVLKKT